MIFKVLGFNKETKLHRVSDMNTSLLDFELYYPSGEENNSVFNLFDSKNCIGMKIEVSVIYPKSSYYFVEEFEIIEEKEILTNKEKFFGIISLKPTDTFERIQARIENRYWLSFSRNIALLSIKELEKRNISEKEFSELMQLNIEDSKNILTGRFDLTLSLICKLQEVLGLEILKENKYRL